MFDSLIFQSCEKSFKSQRNLEYHQSTSHSDNVQRIPKNNDKPIVPIKLSDSNTNDKKTLDNLVRKYFVKYLEING